jgi:hypothetical protein
MKFTKRSAGITAAVVLAGGIAAATTTSAFAASHGSSRTAAAKAAHGKGKGHRKAVAERALLLHSLHGESTVKGKDGAVVVREWQVGKVTAASGTSLTVLSSDGTSWTWTESAQTKMRGQGKDTAVKVGDEVLVRGTKSGAVNDADAVLDPGAAKIAKWEAAHSGAKAGRTGHGKADGSQPSGQPTTAASS